MRKFDNNTLFIVKFKEVDEEDSSDDSINPGGEGKVGGEGEGEGSSPYLVGNVRK